MTTIDVTSLKQRIDAGENLTLIDVREPAEYAEVNIGAKLIPLGQILAGQIDELEDQRNEEIIIHCRSGMRSMQACMMLEQLGFTNTVNVEGGIMAWLQVHGA
jgi:rhodanese-related sulfurtransferase